MSSDTRFTKLANLVLQARALPPDEHGAFLRKACVDDPELYAAAVRLVQVPSAAADRLEQFNPFESLTPRLQLKEGAIFGKYRIVRRLAPGGMSTVYLAEHTRDHHLVAIKFLEPEGLRFSRKEHELLGELSDDNIARLFDSDITEEGIPYLILEYVDGLNVSNYCASHALSLDDRLQLFLAICKGVQHAHSAPIAHRDLKPDNILVTKGGVPKILDFGIARLLPIGVRDAPATYAEQQPKSLLFASPEQVLGQRIGIPSDIYSLGVILCVLTSGRLPYRVRTRGELYTAIPTQEPTPPSQLLEAPGPKDETGELHYPYVGPPPPPGDTRKLKSRIANDLDAIVLKALRKEPQKRHQTVVEFATDVECFLNGDPVPARKGSNWYTVSRYIKKHKWGMASVAAAAVVIVALIVGLAVALGEAARQRDAAALAAGRSAQLSAFLISIFDLGDPFRTVTTPPTVSDLLAQSVQQLRSGKLASNADKVLFLETLGRIYSAQGNYSMALALYEDALRGARDLVEQARILTEIAGAHLDLSQLPEARRALQHAKIIHETGLHAPQEDIVQRLLISGRERSLSGAFVDSVALFRTALSLLVNFPNRQKTSSMLNEELGLSLAEIGKYEESLRSINKALEIEGRFYLETHPVIAKTMMNRAKIFRIWGRYDDASADLQKAENLLVSRLGINHPAVTEVIEERGLLAIEQQHFDIALNLFNHVLEARTHMLGETHLATLRAYQRVGEALQGKGDLPRAEAILRKALADYERLGGDKASLGILLNNLGLLLLQSGRIDESRVLLERALRMREQMHGRTSAWVAVTKGNLSNLYGEQGKTNEAREELQEAIDILKLSLGPNHHYVATGLNNLGFLYADQGDYATALQKYREALAILRRLNLSDRLLAAYFLCNLSDALLETGELQEAHENIDRAQTILRRESDPALPQRDVMDGIEGKYLLLRAEFSEAEAKLLSSFEGLTAKTGSRSRQTRAAAERLIRLYDSWGKPESAARYRRVLADASAQ